MALDAFARVNALAGAPGAGNVIPASALGCSLGEIDDFPSSCAALLHAFIYMAKLSLAFLF